MVSYGSCLADLCLDPALNDLELKKEKSPSPLFQCILIPRCPLLKVVYHKICCINSYNQYHNLTNLAKKTQVRVGIKTMTNLYITTLCLLTVE